MRAGFLGFDDQALPTPPPWSPRDYLGTRSPGKNFAGYSDPAGICDGALCSNPSCVFPTWSLLEGGASQA